MTVSVRLDTKGRALLSRLARRRRATKSQVMRAALEALAREEEGANGNTRPYDQMKGAIGIGTGGGGHLAETGGRHFYELLLRCKARTGK